MRIQKRPLEQLSAAIFQVAGCAESEARDVAVHLVEANLVGHDSHGVIRIAAYINWVREGKLVPNRELKSVLSAPPLAIFDGQLGFGQVMARRVMETAIEMAGQHGIAAVGLRNSGHVGRVGAWAAQAAASGMIAMCFVNTSGGGILVAPLGGIERRLSANPIAIAVPDAGRPPLLLDISTCAIAEGKIRVAFNKGLTVPDGCIIDSQGEPTNDPRVFYGDPPGSILPFGGHKGFGLGIMVEMLAGALTGGGCSRTGLPQLEQAMFALVLDPRKFQPHDTFAAEVRGYIEFVKAARTKTPDGEILMPGEPEERCRSQREAQGIDLDDNTWSQIMGAAQSLGMSTTAFENSRQ